MHAHRRIARVLFTPHDTRELTSHAVLAALLRLSHAAYSSSLALPSPLAREWAQVCLDNPRMPGLAGVALDGVVGGGQDEVGLAVVEADLGRDVEVLADEEHGRAVGGPDEAFGADGAAFVG